MTAPELVSVVRIACCNAHAEPACADKRRTSANVEPAITTGEFLNAQPTTGIAIESDLRVLKADGIAQESHWNVTESPGCGKVLSAIAVPQGNKANVKQRKAKNPYL